MPEIALGGLSALDIPAGVAKSGRRKGAARPVRKAGPKLRKFRAHAILVMGSAAFSALMIGIILNATVMQKEHHPAPLFAPAAPAVAARAPAPAMAPAPLPQAAPATLATPPVTLAEPVSPAALLRGNVAPAASARPKSKPVAASVPHAAKHGDGIARLLGHPATGPAAHTGSAAKPASEPAKVKGAPVAPVARHPLAPPSAKAEAR